MVDSRKPRYARCWGLGLELVGLHTLLLVSAPQEVPSPEVDLPTRLVSTSNYERPPRELATYVPDHASSLIAD